MDIKRIVVECSSCGKTLADWNEPAYTAGERVNLLMRVAPCSCRAESVNTSSNLPLDATEPASPNFIHVPPSQSVKKTLCPACGGSGLSPYPDDGGSCPHCFNEEVEAVGLTAEKALKGKGALWKNGR